MAAASRAGRRLFGLPSVVALGQALPFRDGAFDAAWCLGVLCTTSDKAGALAELRRVLRPGGELRFYEHVLAQDERWSRWQRRLDPVWTRVAGGCHLTRDTEQAIRVAGFDVEQSERFDFAPCAMARLTAAHVLGRARRP
jgi:ubiquinone/menaquinone biosynthesis C-methylase UbiE